MEDFGNFFKGTWMLNAFGSGRCRKRRIVASERENATQGPSSGLFMHAPKMASHTKAQCNDLSMKAALVLCPPPPAPASDNIYSKSIALTIKSEAASSDRFNGVLTGRELIMMRTLTCLLICFLCPSSLLPPSPSRRRNLGISNQVTVLHPPSLPSHVIPLKLSEINRLYLPSPCQPLTLQLLSTRCRICHWSQQTEKNINTDMKSF